MDLTTEAGETSPELPARVFRPRVKSCGNGVWRWSHMGPVLVGEREEEGWLPGTEMRTAERTLSSAGCLSPWGLAGRRGRWAPGCGAGLALGRTANAQRRGIRWPLLPSYALACPGPPLRRTSPFFLNPSYASSLPRVHLFLKA